MAAKNVGEASALRQRLKLVEELVASEGKYVADLGVVKSEFKASRRVPEWIFGNVDEVLVIHRVLYEKLRKTDKRLRQRRNVGEAERELASIFVEMAPFLKASSRYCQNYQKALVAGWPKDLAKDGMDLAGYLVKPMQRITKYPLFFKDLCLRSPQNCPELRRALEAVENVANACNENMDGARVVDIFQNGFDAHESLGTLVTPSRKFLMEGVVTFGLREKGKPQHRVSFFLFNDLFLIAAIHPSRPNKYRLRFRFDLVDLSVLEAIDLVEDTSIFVRYLATFDGGSYSFETGPDLQGADQIDFVIQTGTPALCDTLRASLRTSVEHQKHLRDNLNGRRSRRL